MRILVDAHVFDGTLQGTTTFLKGLYAEAVRDDRHDYFFASRHPERLQEIFGTAPHVHYIRYRFHNKFLRLLWDLPALVKKHRIDWAHFQYVAPPIRNCRFVVTVHDILFLDYPEYFPKGYRFKNRLLFRLSARKADRITTVSEFSRKRLAHHFHLSDVVLTPNAVDPVFFEPYDKAETVSRVHSRHHLGPYWLFVSRWEPRKNHLGLLRTFVEFGHHRDYQLVFVGDPALKDPEYDRYFASLAPEIRSRVVRLEKVAFGEMVDLLRGAALCAYPSFAEGFGIPPLESGAARIPTVCSRATAMADFDFFGRCLFDPNDLQDLDRAVREALQGRDLQGISDAIRSRYSWKGSAMELLRSLEG